MTSEELVNIWQNLPYEQQGNYACEIGRDPQNRKLIDELEVGNYEAKIFAVQTIAGSRDMERALRLSRDIAYNVNRQAQYYLESYGNSSQLKTLFSSPNYKPNKSFIRILIKNQRQETIELLFDALPIGTFYWSKLARYVPPEKVHSCVEARYQHFGGDSYPNIWNNAAIHHPQFIFEKLIERILVVPAPPKQKTLLDRLIRCLSPNSKFFDPLVAQVNMALNGIRLWQPEKAIELVNALLVHQSLAEEESARLQEFKAETLALSVQNLQKEVIPKLSRNLSNSQRERITQILTHNPDALGEPIAWLKQLPPQFRGELWAEFGHRWRDSDDVADIAFLCLLPRETRGNEAAYHLGLAALASKPEKWLPYAALLDFEEARQKIQPFLQDPDSRIRAAAYRALLLSVRFSRSHFSEVLAVIPVGAEDELVQAAIAEGLAALPVSLWSETDLERLENFLGHMLISRARSEEASLHLEHFFVPLLARFPAWAIYNLDALMKGRSYSWHWNLEDRFSDDEILVVGLQLLPTLRKWADSDHNLFLNVMTSFGHRLKRWDEATQLLVDFIKVAPAARAWEAYDILAKYRPDIEINTERIRPRYYPY